MEAVSATEEAFSFVDDSENIVDLQSQTSSQNVEEQASEFEGFGSMFD